MKKRLRRSGDRWRAPKLNVCSECGSSAPSHIVCPSCGFYNGRQVITVDDF